MKIKVFSLVLVAITALSCAEEGKTIIVKNELNLDRAFETVEINLDEITSDETQKNWGIRNASDKSEVTSQLIDTNKDGAWDILLFQPKIKASSEAKFELFPKKNNTTDSTICYSRFVPERTDDYAWENNKVAFRTYGPVAQQMIEDSIPGGTLSSGIDAWLKRVEYPIINKWYAANDKDPGYYHKDHGEGLDNFHVGSSRGIGGIAKKVDSIYYFSKNFISWKTITNGPIRTSFELTYKDWDANGKSITEKKHISLDYGQNLSKITLHIKGVQTISAGITLHQQKGITNTNLQEGWMSYWEPHGDSELGMGIVASPENIENFDKYITNKVDESNLFAKLKLNNEKVSYYAGFGWKKAGEFTTQNEWESYLSDFATKLNSPLKVTIE
ncbi:DUF4861 domain-containing protein [Joostella sp. CR20]|uniref:DUF4861 domain-containing protein n=1 Tax=Joostella sp. CR20 TaxID=2804312 RepID=UPI00313C8FA2